MTPPDDDDDDDDDDDNDDDDDDDEITKEILFVKFCSLTIYMSYFP